METPPVETTATKRSIFARIFISPEEPRLRAGWRLFGHFILLLVTFILGGLLTTPLLFAFPEYNIIVAQFAALIAVTLATWLARRFFDRRSFVSLGLKLGGGVWRDFLAGILIAVIMLGIVFLLEWGFGWMEITGWAWDQTSWSDILTQLFLLVLLFLMIGWTEELLSRGYWLQNIEDGWNTGAAVVISSFLFAIAHIANPGFSLMALGGLFLAGVLIAYAYLRTRQLWLPIGFHFGWNLAEGPLLGFPVSGLDEFRLILQNNLGPDFITGGVFGPEAGLVILPALLAGYLLISWYTQRDRP